MYKQRNKLVSIRVNSDTYNKVCEYNKSFSDAVNNILDLLDGWQPDKYFFKGGYSKHNKKFYEDLFNKLENVLQRAKCNTNRDVIQPSVCNTYQESITLELDDVVITEDNVDQIIKKECIVDTTSSYFHSNYGDLFSSGYYNEIPDSAFLFKNDNKWIAIDNSDWNCWTEEFDTKIEAVKWLMGR